jgi:hypothetical protein
MTPSTLMTTYRRSLLFLEDPAYRKVDKDPTLAVEWRITLLVNKSSLTEEVTK